MLLLFFNFSSLSAHLSPVIEPSFIPTKNPVPRDNNINFRCYKKEMFTHVQYYDIRVHSTQLEMKHSNIFENEMFQNLSHGKFIWFKLIKKIMK